MAGEVLFDTDVLIDAGRGVSTALDVLNEAAKEHTLAVSTITEMELIVGCRNKAELNALDGFLKRFLVLSPTEAITDEGVRLLRRYRLISVTDCSYRMRLTENLPLVSKNQRDYRFIANLQLLPYPPAFR